MTNWIEWHGGECPVPAGTKVDVKFRGGKQSTNLAGRWNYCWENEGGHWDIIAYRIHTDAPQIAPEGYKLVPIDPTPEMIDAGGDIDGSNDLAYAIWSAMIEAAP